LYEDLSVDAISDVVVRNGLLIPTSGNKSE